MRTLFAIALLACLPGIADAQTSSFFSQTTTQQTVTTPPPVVVDATPTCASSLFVQPAFVGYGMGYGGYSRFYGSPFFGSRFSSFGYGGAFIGGARFVGGGRGVFIGGGRFREFSSVHVGPFGGVHAFHSVRRF